MGTRFATLFDDESVCFPKMKKQQSASEPSRWSLSKYAGKFLRKSGSQHNSDDVDRQLEKVDKGNNIIQYKGVSLAHLLHIRDEICAKELAQGVTLFHVKEDMEDLDGRIIPGGKTVLKTGKIRNERDLFLGEVSYMEGSVRLDSTDPRIGLKKRVDWTMEDVCEHFVIRKTIKKKSFYIDTIPGEEVGSLYQGAFVSQSRATRFSDLVDGLVEHYRFKGKTNLDSIFIWIDLFSANQPLLTTRDEDLPRDILEKREQLLYHGFHDAIRYFDELIIFLDSWMNPRPLTRAWCIWEIYGAALSNRTLDVVLSPNQQDKFLETLLNDYEQISHAISKMDMRNAECFAIRDLEMIQNAVEEMEGGFTKLNASVVQELNKWLVKATAKAVASGSENKLAQGKLLLQAGKLMLRQDRLDEAKSYLVQSFQIRIEHHGECSVPVAQVLIELGKYDDSTSSFSESFHKFEKARNIYSQIYGAQEHEDLANVNICLAMALYRLGRSREGVPLVVRAMQMLRNRLGPMCKEMVNALYWYAFCLAQSGQTNDALTAGLRAVRLVKDVYNPRHLMVSRALTCLGTVYEMKGSPEEALAPKEEALQITEETLGRDSTDTARMMVNLGITKRELRIFQEARHLQEEGLGIFLNSYGPSHRRTAWAMSCLSETLEELGEYDEALMLCQNSKAIQEKLLGKKHTSTQINADIMKRLQESVKRRNKQLGLLPKLRAAAEDNLEALEELSKTLAMSKLHVEEGILVTRRLWQSLEQKYGPDEAVDLQCSVLERLGKLLEAAHEMGEAREIYTRCVNIQIKAGKRVDRGLLAKVERHKNLEDLKRAKSTFRDLKMKGEDCADQSFVVANILMDLNRKWEAVPYLENAVDTVRDQERKRKWLIDLADLLIETRKFKKAIIRLEQIAKISSSSSSSSSYADTLIKMSTVHQRMYNFEKALELGRKAWKITKETPETDERKVRERVDQLFVLLVELDHIDEAQALMHETMAEELSFGSRIHEIQSRRAAIAEQGLFDITEGAANRDVEMAEVGWLWLECGNRENAIKQFQGLSPDVIAKNFDTTMIEEIAYLFECKSELTKAQALIEMTNAGTRSLRYALQRVELKMKIREFESTARAHIETDPLSAAELFLEARELAADDLQLNRNENMPTALELVQKAAPESILHAKILYCCGMMGTMNCDEYHAHARDILTSHQDLDHEVPSQVEIHSYLGKILYFSEEHEDIPRSKEMFQTAFRLAKSCFGQGSLEVGKAAAYLALTLDDASKAINLLDEVICSLQKHGHNDHDFIIVNLSMKKLQHLEPHHQEAAALALQLHDLHLREGFHDACEAILLECQAQAKQQ